MCPIGAASGGEPASMRTRSISVSTSSRRPPAFRDRSATSAAVTIATGILRLAARTAIRGRSGVTGCVADVLVHEVGGIPEDVLVDAGVESEPHERLSGGLGRDAMRCERDRVDGAGDQVGPAPSRLERHREGVPPRPLAVEADRQARQLVQLGHELSRPPRLEEPGGVVEQHPCRADLGQALRGVDERVAAVAAVQEPSVELAPGGQDRLGRVAQVLDVVQRVVHAEDVDPTFRRRRDEPPRDIASYEPRADEEAPAHRERERRLGVRLQRADPLPGALDTATNGGVEDPAAGDLEVGEAGAVQDLGELEQRGGRHHAGKRLLPEDANRGIDQLWHDVGP